MRAGYDQIHSAAAFVGERLAIKRPRVGLVLGSGLGAFAEELENGEGVDYAAIPHFPVSTVDGHHGRLLAGAVRGCSVVVMQGRVHGYEGYDPGQVVFGVRAMMALGVRTLILTNAAGGVNPAFVRGDLMLLSDHINLTGKSPLSGPHDARLGPRFPDMSAVYPRELRELAHSVAHGLRFALREGVYLGFNGPQYETPAEIRMCRLLGADAVGMSTVHEAIACAHGGARVLGISCITNLAAGLSGQALSHQEVKETAAAVEDRFSNLLSGVCERLC
jgi:purine-nucleoside phosphorylase